MDLISCLKLVVSVPTAEKLPMNLIRQCVWFVGNYNSHNPSGHFNDPELQANLSVAGASVLRNTPKVVFCSNDSLPPFILASITL